MKNSGIEIQIVGRRSSRSRAVKVKILEAENGRAIIAPVNSRNWHIAKNRLINNARGCFAGSKNNGELLAVLSPSTLLRYLEDRHLIAL